ncbi:MAG: CapA family protein [Candidatus Helarchaeota archaeon]
MKDKIILTFVGDISLSSLFVLDKKNNKKRFKDVFRLFNNSDLVFANLEAPLKGNGEFNTNKDISLIQYSTKQVYDYILPRLKISVVSLANNHIYDCGESGIKNTTEYLRQNKILYTGAGLEKKEIEPVIINKNGYKIGFIAYVDKNTNPMIDSPNMYVNYFNESKIIKDIKTLNETCKCIVVSIHWGIDYSYYPTKYQRDVSKKFINSGANIIMGHHTHTLQPFELYKSGVIFYSLGTFCHGDFYVRNKLRNLHLKATRSIIANINIIDKSLYVIPIRTQKYNFIKMDTVDIYKLNNKKLQFTELIHRNLFCHKIFFIKEMIFDKIIDYFFGYYKNPIRQLFSFSYFKKAKNYIRDFLWKFRRQL